jgi:membrane protein involved in colicin uptake
VQGVAVDPTKEFEYQLAALQKISKYYEAAKALIQTYSKENVLASMENLTLDPKLQALLSTQMINDKSEYTKYLTDLAAEEAKKKAEEEAAKKAEEAARLAAEAARLAEEAAKKALEDAVKKAAEDAAKKAAEDAAKKAAEDAAKKATEDAAKKAAEDAAKLA